MYAPGPGVLYANLALYDCASSTYQIYSQHPAATAAALHTSYHLLQVLPKNCILSSRGIAAFWNESWYPYAPGPGVFLASFIYCIRFVCKRQKQLSHPALSAAFKCTLVLKFEDPFLSGDAPIVSFGSYAPAPGPALPLNSPHCTKHCEHQLATEQNSHIARRL